MTKDRLEAFSDGVIAILITIMVLELRTPVGTDWAALRPLVPVLLTYLLSFVFLGIYWNNHHHMLHAAHRINGKVLWANLHLLFWLSLVPFVTGWMGKNHFESIPTAVYGIVPLMAAVAYTILKEVLVAAQGPGSRLEAALAGDTKGKVWPRTWPPSPSPSSTSGSRTRSTSPSPSSGSSPIRASSRAWTTEA